jgi:hypothetical protein
MKAKALAILAAATGAATNDTAPGGPDTTAAAEPTAEASAVGPAASHTSVTARYGSITFLVPAGWQLRNEDLTAPPEYDIAYINNNQPNGSVLALRTMYYDGDVADRPDILAVLASVTVA